jgi:hypothetical protein
MECHGEVSSAGSETEEEEIDEKGIMVWRVKY